jgi:hypothetical protein
VKKKKKRKKKDKDKKNRKRKGKKEIGARGGGERWVWILFWVFCLLHW